MLHSIGELTRANKRAAGVSPAGPAPMFIELEPREIRLLTDAVPLHREGRMYEFTEEQHRLWPRMLEIMERNGRRLDPFPQRPRPGPMG